MSDIFIPFCTTWSVQKHKSGLGRGEGGDYKKKNVEMRRK